MLLMEQLQDGYINVVTVLWHITFHPLHVLCLRVHKVVVVETTISGIVPLSEAGHHIFIGSIN